MDEKLAEYRKQKQKQFLQQQRKEIAISIIQKITNLLSLNKTFPNNEFEQDSPSKSNDSSIFPIVTNICIFILWAAAYLYFIYIEFGAVFFCISALIFVYYNTRTEKKQRDEVSAYSVFNRNCERIDGTFSAEDFEKQLRTGMY